MPVYYKTQGHAEHQSSLLMAYDDANADYGQYQDLNRDKKLAADGHY
jgi:hypothetical protein